MIEIRHQLMERTSDTQHAYNDIYTHGGIQHQDSFYYKLIKIIDPKPGQKLLDISCGQGRLVQLAEGMGIDATGADFAFHGVNVGRKGEPRAQWLVADGEIMPIASDSMDYVSNIGSLEHFQDLEAGIREISRILKPSGIACILVPNTFSLIGNIQYVLKTGHVFDDGQPLQRYNTRGGWHDLLIKNGLLPFRTIGHERAWPHTLQDLLWVLVRPSKVLRLLISPFIPVNLANCLIYLCHRDS